MPFFVVHEHHARRLHFDLRLEIEGVLKSWAIPKGPSLNPKEKRLAIMVEDHPIEYGDFEGIVIIWDRGRFDIEDGSIEKGRLNIIFYGRKLRGAFSLIRLKGMSGRDKEWLLIKKADEYADYGFKLKTKLKEKNER
jgi:bifunctional non-homologous end joining protein LigD